MTRANRFILRTLAAVLGLLVGIVVAVARCAMGHEAYTALAVALVYAWCMLPSAEDRHALGQAQRDDGDGK